MSLHVPEHFKVFRVMGFDPGLTNAGVSVIDVDYKTRKLLSVTALTLVPHKLNQHQDIYPGDPDSAINRIYRLRSALRCLLEYYNPCAFASEDAFYHPLMPNAYGVLKDVIMAIRAEVYSYNYNVPFILIEPRAVKRLVGAGIDGTDKKELMREAIRRKIDIMSVLHVDLNILDQHAVDAIAVAYSMLHSTQ